jgi:hypothetical protein
MSTCRASLNTYIIQEGVSLQGFRTHTPEVICIHICHMTSIHLNPHDQAEILSILQLICTKLNEREIQAIYFARWVHLVTASDLLQI